MKRQYLNEQLNLVDYPSPNSYYGEMIVDFNDILCEGFADCNEDNRINSCIKASMGIPKRDIKLDELLFLAEMSAFCFLCNDYERVQNILLKKIGFNIINSVINKSTNEKYMFFSYITTNKQSVYQFNYAIYISNKDASIKRLSFFCTKDQTENLYPINPVSLFDILLNIYLDINNLVLGKLVEEKEFWQNLLTSLKNSLNIWNTNIIEPMFFFQIPSFQERNKIFQIYNENREEKTLSVKNTIYDFLNRLKINTLKRKL